MSEKKTIQLPILINVFLILLVTILMVVSIGNYWRMLFYILSFYSDNKFSKKKKKLKIFCLQKM